MVGTQKVNIIIRENYTLKIKFFGNGQMKIFSIFTSNLRMLQIRSVFMNSTTMCTLTLILTMLRDDLEEVFEDGLRPVLKHRVCLRTTVIYLHTYGKTN